MAKKAMLAALAMVFAACQTTATQEERLAPRRSTSVVRLDDIKKEIGENPVKAIDLIGIYREIYSVTQNDNENWNDLVQLENDALETLRLHHASAIEKERWDDAASLSRSLAGLGIETEAGTEADYILAGAKQKLADNNDLGAFLGAVQAHELRPLDFDSGLLFLERAVNVKQRRAAAFFLSAAESAGGEIPGDMRSFAMGRDTVSDMLNGVATVIVDKGIRIEAGRGFPDRVIGSAFFVDASGLLVTNYHVISSEVDTKYRGYSRMYIRMGDPTSPRIPARVIGWDKAMDLALIKTEFEPEFVFSVVDRVIPMVGDTVLAIGSPGGLEKTVTSGIVSTLSRRFLQIGDVYQIDAAINYGNSGGPVVDNVGRLVGIVFAGIPSYQGLNFAVPAERLAAALPAMIAGGKAQRPWLGLTLNETNSGAEIIYVAPNTPAMQHRVPENSIIKTINGREITAAQGALIPAIQDVIFQSRPGELIALETIDTDGVQNRRVIMTVARPEIPLLDAAKIDRRERMAAPLFGLILSPSQGGSSSNYTVRKVVRGSVADEAGISERDPVAIRRMRIMEDRGIALLDIAVQKRRMGFIETTMQLPAWLDSPDTF
ncbi:MAG: S1C family serine protease [Treponema sp.]|nr:S1C family serine protease [Treponema sp.]